MKNLIIAFVATIATFFFSFNANTQEKASNKKTQVVTIKVAGNCGECKTRIENASYIKGVKRAEWNQKSKELKLVFNSHKTTLEKIEQNIANHGHDAGDIKASQEAYDSLPACCAYHDVDDH